MRPCGHTRWAVALRYRFGALYVLLALIGLGSLAAFGLQLTSGPGERTAGSSRCGARGAGSAGLYSVQLASGASVQLVAAAGVDHPAVSPDGKRIAFLAGSNGILARLQVCDLRRHSTEQPRLPVPASDFPLSWAASARTLLFLGGDLAGQGADQKPFLLTLEGGRTRQLGGEAAWYWDGAAISPDGTKLALLLQWKYPHGHEPEQLALYDVRTGTLERLVGSSQVAEIDALSWSPDGRRIVFSAYRGNPRGALYVVDASTRRVSPLLAGGPGARQPAWSPDGSRIAFVRPGRRPSIWLLDLATRAVRRVTRDGTAPAWSPDAGTLVFARGA